MTASPLWHQSMRSDKSAAKPPTWGGWKERYGFWNWVMWPEWAAEWVVHWSRSWDFVKVLELAGRFTILIVAVTWLFGAEEREKARLDAIKSKHYRAWELINSARGSTGDGGRRDALQDLHEERVSLAGAPLSQAELEGVQLPEANLRGADLSRANLLFANLSRANLSWANLSRAELIEANLSRANLGRADLSGVDLSGANLSRANLGWADLSGTDLNGTNLSGADLSGANLSRADLSRADLSGADLNGAVFDETAEPPSGWQLYKDEQGKHRLRRAGPPPPARTPPPP